MGQRCQAAISSSICSRDTGARPCLRRTPFISMAGCGRVTGRPELAQFWARSGPVLGQFWARDGTSEGQGAVRPPPQTAWATATAARVRVSRPGRSAVRGRASGKAPGDALISPSSPSCISATRIAQLKFLARLRAGGPTRPPAHRRTRRARTPPLLPDTPRRQNPKSGSDADGDS